MSGSVRGVVEKSPRLLDAVGRPKSQPHGEAFFKNPLAVAAGRVTKRFLRFVGIVLCPAATSPTIR